MKYLSIALLGTTILFTQQHQAHANDYSGLQNADIIADREVRAQKYMEGMQQWRSKKDSNFRAHVPTDYSSRSAEYQARQQAEAEQAARSEAEHQARMEEYRAYKESLAAQQAQDNASDAATRAQQYEATLAARNAALEAEKQGFIDTRGYWGDSNSNNVGNTTIPSTTDNGHTNTYPTLGNADGRGDLQIPHHEIVDAVTYERPDEIIGTGLVRDTTVTSPRPVITPTTPTTTPQTAINQFFNNTPTRVSGGGGGRSAQDATIAQQH